MGATAFTIALAWNEAVNNTIQSIYPKSRKGASIVYAIVVTLIVIFAYAITVHVSHYAKKAGEMAKFHITKFVTGWPPPGSVIAPPVDLSLPTIKPPVFNVIDSLPYTVM